MTTELRVKALINLTGCGADYAELTVAGLDAVDPLRLALTNPSDGLLQRMWSETCDNARTPDERMRAALAALAAEFGVTGCGGYDEPTPKETSVDKQDSTPASIQGSLGVRVCEACGGNWDAHLKAAGHTEGVLIWAPIRIRHCRTVLIAERDRLRDMVAALEAETAHDGFADRIGELHRGISARDAALAQERREKDAALENLRLAEEDRGRLVSRINAAHEGHGRTLANTADQIKKLTARIEEVTAERDHERGKAEVLAATLSVEQAELRLQSELAQERMVRIRDAADLLYGVRAR